jgi:hypothetical protein
MEAKNLGRTERLEQFCRNANCVVLPKQSTRYGNILLAERQKRTEEGAPYFETFWFLERDNVDMGRCVRNNVYEERNGLLRMTTQDERIREAVADAEQFIQDNLDAGRYDA